MNKDFPVIRKGYDPQQVDSYITSLEKELNNYKEKEQAITQAIVRAQIISEQLISEAKEDAANIKEEAKARLSKIQNMLDKIEESLKTFQEDYKKFISKYLVQFDERDIHPLIEELHNIRESFDLKNCTALRDFDGTQAQRLSEQVHQQQNNGVSEEEMNSLFGKKE